MHREISTGVWIGSEHACYHGEREGWAAVHACKTPCHQRAVGYHGNLSSQHPHYLVLERGSHLYLNMIDPDRPLFRPPLFVEFLSFVQRMREGRRQVLIHCNQGRSRAPSLGLLYMAKIAAEIDGDSYEVAQEAYQLLDENYRPGLGIQRYLAQNWDTIE